jgi:hypothetical protein
MAETSNTGTAAGLITDGLLTTAETEHQVEGGLLLDVVVSKCASILELLASKDKPLLVRGDALLVLDLGLDIVDGVGRLHLKGDSLASQGLHEDLHASPQAKHQMEGALLLDIVVSERAPVLELLASEDEPLLVRGDALLVLDLGLDVVNGVRRLHLKGDGLAGEGLHKDLHLQKRTRQQGKCLAVNKQNYIKQTATIYSNRYQQVMCVHHIISTKHAIFQVHRSKGKEHS